MKLRMPRPLTLFYVYVGKYWGHDVEQMVVPTSGSFRCQRPLLRIPQKRAI